MAEIYYLKLLEGDGGDFSEITTGVQEQYVFLQILNTLDGSRNSIKLSANHAIDLADHIKNVAVVAARIEERKQDE